MLVYKSNEIFTGLDERGKLQINPTVQWSGYSPGMWENPVTVPAEMNVNYVLEEEHFQRERLRGTYSLPHGLSHFSGRFVFCVGWDSLERTALLGSKKLFSIV